MRSIGIRELRQHASEYIRLVEAGESIEVTDRGRPVAMITPIKKDETTIERLNREGILTPGNGKSILDHPPLPALPEGPTLSEVLAQMREHER
ncbi:MAG: hypothetical protein C0506_13835 [Anaerolinea sp.]|nr:hypothetical protein [Anaerolinea sp.]